MNIKDIVTRALSDSPSPPLSEEEIKYMANHILQDYKEVWCDNHEGEKTRWGGLLCKKCGASLGWYCPNSPDHRCYYFSEETLNPLIRKVTGTKFTITVDSDYDPYCETDDYCLFCGHPHERK